MVWSRLRQRRERPTPKLPLPGPCRHRRHTLRTERLLLYTPETVMDFAAVAAAASDPEARRWLGWGKDEGVVTDAHVREAVLQLLPGDTDFLRSSPLAQRLLAHPFDPRVDQGEALIGVRLDDGRYAGFTKCLRGRPGLQAGEESDPCGAGQETGFRPQ
ncbi:hypothetical protein ACWDA7_29950, partial [Streptomyces sp. NPDC001156]